MKYRVVVRTLDQSYTTSSLQTQLKSVVPTPEDTPPNIYSVELDGPERVFVLEATMEEANALFQQADRLPGYKLSWDVSYRNVPIVLGIPGCAAPPNADFPRGRSDAPMGQDVLIAVIDEHGVNPHAAFGDRLLARYEIQNGEFKKAGAPSPNENHGTMVAGVAAGAGECASSAPGASIVGVKVSPSALGIVQAIDEVTKRHPKVRVFCIAMEAAMNDLPEGANESKTLHDRIGAMWKKGIITCVSAGNGGPNGKIQSPGVAESALTVGGFDNNGSCNHVDDHVTRFSSRGDTGDKPDFLEWWGPRRTAELVDKNGTPKSDNVDFSGTSCAVGYAAGLVAGWFEAVPALKDNPDKIRTTLKGGRVCRQLPEEQGGAKAPRSAQGHGALNPIRMLEELRKR